jgi:hypothetical protein
MKNDNAKLSPFMELPPELRLVDLEAPDFRHIPTRFLHDGVDGVLIAEG